MLLIKTKGKHCDGKCPFAGSEDGCKLFGLDGQTRLYDETDGLHIRLHACVNAEMEANKMCGLDGLRFVAAH